MIYLHNTIVSVANFCTDNYLWSLLAWIVFFCIYTAAVGKDTKPYKVFAWISIIAYGILLLGFTLFNRSMGSVSYNLVPFSDIAKTFSGSFYWINHNLGNICIFIPFGILLSSREKMQKWYRTLLGGVVLSLVIEVIQLLTGMGVFEVDDLILNTMGAVIGYFLGKLIFFVASKLDIK